ncbi:hypothetical protein D3C75_826540 [compost metagenome]
MAAWNSSARVPLRVWGTTISRCSPGSCAHTWLTLSTWSMALPAYWYPAQAISSLGSIWPKRSMMPCTPNSGEELDHTAPRLVQASMATSVCQVLGMMAATRSPGTMPVALKAVCRPATWAASWAWVNS